MTKSYSLDLRRRVARFVEAGHSCHAAARYFDVSVAYVVRLMAAYRATGSLAAKPEGGWRYSKLDPHREFLLQRVAEKREITADRPTGPRAPHSTVLSVQEEAIVVAFRKHTLLPLDDCLYALQPTIPHLTRSSLHRCLQRHGISRVPEVTGDKPAKTKFKSYPIGYFHIDIAEVHTEEGKLYLFVAIDRTSKFAFAELHEKATTQTSKAFLRALVGAVPYRIHTVLTDNGIQFAELPKNRCGPTALLRGHPFDRVCREHGIEH